MAPTTDVWQGMDTAPKDREVILCQGGRIYSPCFFQAAGVISEDDFWGWWQHDTGGFFVELVNPTHWTELTLPLEEPLSAC